jgi:hypothetical protein
MYRVERSLFTLPSQVGTRVCMYTHTCTCMQNDAIMSHACTHAPTCLWCNHECPNIWLTYMRVHAVSAVGSPDRVSRSGRVVTNTQPFEILHVRPRETNPRMYMHHALVDRSVFGFRKAGKSTYAHQVNACMYVLVHACRQRKKATGHRVRTRWITTKHTHRFVMHNMRLKLTPPH